MVGTTAAGPAVAKPGASAWIEKRTVGAQVNWAAGQWGEREALTFVDGSAVRRWTFAELRADVDRAAKALLQAGVGPGETVALWLNNRPEWLHILFAVAKVGGTLVPVNTRFRTSDLAYVLRHSDATTLITADVSGPVRYIDMVRELTGTGADARALAVEEFPALRRVIVLSDQAYAGTLRWESLLAEGAGAERDRELREREAAVDPEGTLFVLYTSGTTGFPKGVMHNHDILRLVGDHANRMAVRQSDVILMYLPLFHSFGLHEGAMMPIVSGARQVLMAQFDAGEALRLIARERPTLLHGFDTHFREIMDHPDCERTDRSSVRTGMLAAGLASSETVARRAQRTLGKFVSAWGMTEMGASVSLGLQLDSEDDRCLASGSPMPGMEFRVIDPATGQDVPPGQPGELLFRGYSIMQGYYKMPEQTEAAFDKEGWFHSGDTASMRADGTIRFLGRYKDMLKVGGENVDPAEVEARLLQHPAVQQAVVVGVPDTRLSEVACAYVVLEADASASTEDLVGDWRGSIASFKIPRHVLFLDELPMTPTGKVQKFKLREMAVRELGLGEETRHG